ncbi:hypothetical protein AAG906_003317 [Vitis piasezkii]
MTQQDASANSDVVTVLFKFTLYLLDLLGMPLASMYFDLIIATLMRYSGNVTDLVLLDLLDFHVILGIDWLASYHPPVDCFGKRVMFHILSQSKFSFEGKHVDCPLRIISTLQASFLNGVEFTIDLVLVTTPISKIPYRMALVEIKELKV